MSGNSRFYRIYVDYDSLLDTRLSTLFNLCKGNDELFKALYTKDYFDRLNDNFPVIGEEFKQSYLNRNRDTLRNAVMTRIPFKISELIKLVLKSSLGQPFDSIIFLDINIYPYQLSKEAKDAITDAINNIIKDTAVINIISVPKEQLTPKHINSYYDSLFMYDFKGWFQYQLETKNFNITQCQNVNLYTPLIIEDTESYNKLIKKARFDKVPLNDILCSHIHLFINVIFLSIEDFSCIVNPFNENE